MKVLWITNILFPEAQKLLKGKGELRASGGWMLGAANELVKRKDVVLAIATVSKLVSKLEFVKGENICYFIIPFGKGNLKYNSQYESFWGKIEEMFLPDIVHIHGSEYSHGLAYVNKCGSEKVLLSIQGLKSGIYPYYHNGISKWEILKNMTLHDVLGKSIFNEKYTFKMSSELEKELILKVHHVIGRTSWDRARTWAINPDINYHFCNETLRNEFYDGSLWSYENCQKHSIFLSQANGPIKGLHQVLKAMPIILRHYPDTIVRIAGEDITKFSGIKGWIHYNGYMKYINKLVSKYNLQNHIVFTDPLNAEEMKHEYLNSNVFVCPSTIENSPNSIGEAQILGVPCVASFVGGVMDMMKGDEDNLYRFEETEMLAEKVCAIFRESKDTSLMRERAVKRHNPKTNSEQLYHIYQSILL